MIGVGQEMPPAMDEIAGPGGEIQNTKRKGETQ